MYVAPEWGAAGPIKGSGSEFSFEVIKDGVVLPERFIFSGRGRNGDHFTLGRQEEVVDFVMSHPSISRVHAALHYRAKDGALMLLDLGSAQGSVVNKKPCVPGTYERLYVGDVIKFGASSRIYCVDGPSAHTLEEYDSENLRAYRSRIAELNMEASKRADDNNSISWGIQENTIQDDDLNPSQDDETERDKPLREKIRTKERKLANLQEETRRIYLKETNQENGLSAGQLATVDRNAKSSARLEHEILELLSSAQNKLVPGEAQTKREDDDDGECIDESWSNADVTTNWRLKRQATRAVAGKSIVWTLESLLSEGEKVKTERTEIQSKILAIREAVLEDESTDEVCDRVIKEEKDRERQTHLNGLKMQDSRLAESEESLMKLIAIAAPALGGGKGDVPKRSMPSQREFDEEMKRRKTLEEPSVAAAAAAVSGQGKTKYLRCYVKES